MVTTALLSRQGLLPVDLPERRGGLSEPAHGAGILERAITYLVQEQTWHSDHNRYQAIVLLCRALERIAEMERRVPARRSIRRWLASLALMPRC